MMPINKTRPLLSIDLIFDTPEWAKSRLSARKRVSHVLHTAWNMVPGHPRHIYPEITITLTNDASIQILNRDYRDKDKPTNVLSFPMWNNLGEIPDNNGGGASFPLGDIIIAFETISREATEQEKPLADHFTHMLVHGFLHLLGYDHMKDEEARVMESLEIKILKKLLIPNPYV